MNKLEYIPGDLVMTKTETNNFIPNGVVCKFYDIFRDKVFVSTVMLADNFTCKKEDIAPIPLTPEILEKNGWKSINGKYALKIKNANYVVLEFTEDGIYTYINENTMLFTIKYIHELQHLLYALHIDSNLKI